MQRVKNLTRCSAIAEKPRCRVRYSFGQNWEAMFTDIIGLSTTTVIQLAWESVEFGEKNTLYNGYYGAQGHSRSSRSVPIESPYMTSY